MTPRQRALTTGFIVLWLAVQLIVPLVQKFELPAFRYRYARFSWAMYSRPVQQYELSIFRERTPGVPEAIPNVQIYDRKLASPGPVKLHGTSHTPEEVQERTARLITHLARARGDGYTYVATIHWGKYRYPRVPERWEFRVDAGR